MSESRQYRIEVHFFDGHVEQMQFYGSRNEVMELVKCECRGIAVKEVRLFEESKYKGHTNHIVVGRFSIKRKTR